MHNSKYSFAPYFYTEIRRINTYIRKSGIRIRRGEAGKYGAYTVPYNTYNYTNTDLANPNHYTVPCGLNALAVQIGISDIDVTSYNMYLWQAPLDVDTWDVNDKCVCMCACVHVCNATCPWHFLSVLACPSLAWHVPGGLK